jgi:hypothetical protein
MLSFNDYMLEVLSVYDSSWKNWTQETRANTSLVSVSYDKCHALHIGADRKLTLEEALQDDACEKFASEVRLCISKETLDGSSEDAVLKRIGEATKKAIDSGVAQNVSTQSASFRIIIARR